SDLGGIDCTPSKKKESGRFYSRSRRLSFTRVGFRASALVRLVRMELDCVDFIHELFQLVGGDVVPHGFINPAENLICGCRRSTCHASREASGYPARSRWSAEGRNNY